jgi:CTP:phosphocholine cytidylyltransferase-like protein
MNSKELYELDVQANNAAKNFVVNAYRQEYETPVFNEENLKKLELSQREWDKLRNELFFSKGLDPQELYVDKETELIMIGISYFTKEDVNELKSEFGRWAFEDEVKRETYWLLRGADNVQLTIKQLNHLLEQCDYAQSYWITHDVLEQIKNDLSYEFRHLKEVEQKLEKGEGNQTFLQYQADIFEKGINEKLQYIKVFNTMFEQDFNRRMKAI